MRVLLINPGAPGLFPPPAIGYLAAALRYCLPEVDVIAADLLYACGLLAIGEHFDFVCASFHSFSAKFARLIRHRAKGSNARLICGGHHPSSSLGWQLEQDGWEVVKGEGEEALVNIVAGTPGQWRFGGVSDFPAPDYAGLGGEWKLGGAHAWPIISSRGCPFDCSFCASSAFWKRRWSGRSPRDVLAELDHIIRHHGVRAWMFEDDNFTLQPHRAIDICRGIKDLQKEYGRGLSWQLSLIHI